MIRNNKAPKIRSSLPLLVCMTLSGALIVMAYGGASSKVTNDAAYPRHSENEGLPPAAKSATTEPDNNPTPDPIDSPPADSAPDIVEGCPAIKYVNRNSGTANITQLRMDRKYVSTGATRIRATIDDPSPNQATELRTKLKLYINNTLYSYCPELKNASDTVDLLLPTDVHLDSGSYVTLEAVEIAKKNGEEVEVKSNKEAAYALLEKMPPNPFKLQQSSKTSTPGCHAQGIKFDGAYFFSSCQQIADDLQAFAYIHDFTGKRLCEFEIGPDYDHPGGLMTVPGELGAAYVGFSVWQGAYPNSDNNRSQPLKISYKNGKCSKVRLNNGTTLNNTTGFAVRRPKQTCDELSAWDTEILFYDDYTANLNICKPPVESATPTPSPACEKKTITALTIKTYSSQDCAYYFANGWLRACIAVSNDDNLIQVFNADAASMDESQRLGKTIYLSATVPKIGRYSGGFDIYQTPSGSRYVVIAPDSTDGGDDCGGRQPCTDTKMNQWVEFYLFDTWSSQWPKGNCK